MKSSEILEIATQRDYSSYELRSPEVQRYLVKLNSLAWRLSKEPLEDQPPWVDSPSSAPFVRPINEDEAASRSWEIACLSAISWIRHTGSIGALGNLIETIEEEAMTGRAPYRSAMFGKGMVLYGLKRYNASQLSFLRGHAQYATSGTVTPFFSYSRSVRIWPAPDKPILPRTNIGAPEAVHLITSGNPSYIKQFFSNYIASISKYSDATDPVLKLTLLIMETGRPEDDLDIDQELSQARSLFGNRFNHKTVRMPPEVRDHRAWLASQRFIALPTLVGEGEFIIVTDIDFAVSGSLDAFLKEASTFDCCVNGATRNSLQEWVPWLKYMAGLVTFSDFRVATQFSRQFKTLFDEVFTSQIWTWGIDQNLITTILDHSHLSLGKNLGSNPFYVPNIPRP